MRTESEPIVHPVADEALGNTSYLVVVDDRTAVCIDPRRDVDEHLALAGRLGVRIAGVLETHLHADFVSGAREIADATGAEIFAARDASLAFPHTPVEPGARVRVGGATIEVLATPGHTPEHIAFLLGGRALFSGGSLIVGGAARTDLTGAERIEELTRAQFATLRRLAALPGETTLHPTHGAGSFCSTGRARSRESTIAGERAGNPLLAIEDEDTFVKLFLEGLGSFPTYFSHLRDVNRHSAPLLRTLPEVPELTGSVARSLVDRGASLVDGRNHETWAAAHPAGAISIEVRPAFASWLGWVVPFGEPVVLVLDPEQAGEAVRLSRRIGYDRIAGWLPFDSWRDADLPVERVETIDATAVAGRAREGAVLLDIRQRSEFVTSHIAGARHLELGEIIAGKTPDASEVIPYCGHGERSATAASLLAREGIHVANLRGGTGAWRQAGLPFET